VIVALRDAVVVFATAVYRTVVDPVPFAADVTVSQSGLLLTAVHAHPFELAVRLNDPLAPEAATLADDGDTEYAHVPAACVTVKVCPATVSVPVRSTVNWFA
jgi:hypothetical protein